MPASLGAIGVAVVVGCWVRALHLRDRHQGGRHEKHSSVCDDRDRVPDRGGCRGPRVPVGRQAGGHGQARVALHGGQMGVRSQEGYGATFWFRVPLVQAQTAATVPQPDEALPLDEALRILLVDDNAMNLMVARLQLQKCWPRAEIVTLDSAAQALVLLDAQGFDVALVDMVMPEMDGMALARQIRHRFPAITARMPIIALTANTNPVDRQRCLDAGMDDVLDKPMDLQTLVRCVSRHVLKARA